MAYIRLANFFELYSIRTNGTENVLYRYNNSVPGNTLRYSDKNFDYLSFIYQGAAKNRTGDNLEAQLVLAVNPISTGLAREAVKNNYLVRVYSAVMNDNDTVNKVLTEENWLAASLSYDCETLEVILSSAIDAVGANAPTRVLTRGIVGNLPVTGNINTQ